ncbi:nudC domain-containing protein 2-like [Oscarella lobularis]|uniref:nudC domain-containing protein 2-like n=1 Tax=Oscarella lobularis TaxID=121494 RepID=UPI0033132985
MTHFDEKAGIVQATTPWGSWSQTMDEIVIEVNVEDGTRGRDVTCDIKPSQITLNVKGKTILKGELFRTVIADDSVWTIEDQRLVRLTLVKSSRHVKTCWEALLKDQYALDAITLQNMQKKMALEKYQRQHPGFDFSGADVTGNYVDGGAPDDY